jgi:hypothetical protein
MCPVSSRPRHNSGTCRLFPGVMPGPYLFCVWAVACFALENTYFARYPMLYAVSGKVQLRKIPLCSQWNRREPDRGF